MSNLFDWQRAVHAADLDADLQLFALRLSLDSAGATGVVVVVNEASLMADRGLSSSTVWRRVRTLVDEGWLGKVRAASKADRARYVLLIPASSSVTCPRDVTDDADSTSVNGRLAVTDVHGSSVIAPPTVTDDQIPTSVTAPPELTDVAGDNPVDNRPTSVTPHEAMTGIQTVTTNTAAAARAIPRPPAVGIPASGQVADLAAGLARHKPLAGLRWDAVGRDKLARIAALAELHGVRRLVDVAIASLRDPAPIFAQAFLGTWEALPDPTTAGTARTQCPVPGHTDDTERGCRQCAAEQRAAG